MRGTDLRLSLATDALFEMPEHRRVTHDARWLQWCRAALSLRVEVPVDHRAAARVNIDGGFFAVQSTDHPLLLWRLVEAPARAQLERLVSLERDDRAGEVVDLIDEAVVRNREDALRCR